MNKSSKIRFFLFIGNVISENIVIKYNIARYCKLDVNICAGVLSENKSIQCNNSPY